GLQIPYETVKDFVAPVVKQESKAPAQQEKKPTNRTRRKNRPHKPRRASGHRKGGGPKRKKVRGNVR
ncbi:MAG: hypothetical protein AAF438_13405, partial [Pseudomonadota bacterium]